MGTTPSAATTSDRSGELLERSGPLEQLAQSLAAVTRASRGRMLLVEGEAGAGKTALLRRFCDDAPARVLWGGCDALHTPTPLGPLRDVALTTGGELAERLFLSEKTVAHHVSVILRKLGAATRAEASAEAVRRGL